MPVCGTVNKELYLDETDGWMECEHCHNDVQLFLRPKLKAIPRLREMRSAMQGRRGLTR